MMLVEIVKELYVLQAVLTGPCRTLRHFILWKIVTFSHSVTSDSFETPWAVARQVPLSMGFFRPLVMKTMPFCISPVPYGRQRALPVSVSLSHTHRHTHLAGYYR